MLKCQFCGRDLKNQWAKNLHERACSENPKNKETEEKEKETEKKKCNHNLILLNPNIASQRRAINDGYSAFCTKCKDLV